MTILVVIAIEDELSEAVLRKLIEFSGRDIVVDRAFNARGNSQLKNRIANFKSASHVLPHVVLTDLDRYPCAPELLDDWNAVNLPSRMLFRIAVREIESWLLADRAGIAEFLNVAVNKVPDNPEAEIDPKRTLINLARRSRRRRLSQELVPAQGSAAPIGPLYNSRMTEFVNTNWDIAAARGRAQSMDRALSRLSTFMAD